MWEFPPLVRKMSELAQPPISYPCEHTINFKNPKFFAPKKQQETLDFFALIVKKNFDFSKFMVCPQGHGRGFEPVRTFADGGEWVGSIFRDFVRMSFMDGPYRLRNFLITSENLI